ncbi:MAG: zinc ABC transporter substrate-binding protein [Verrucomicrobia bacterium]|nr:zinc ABC transporter substrate-binding protein [Verrucomicrobiota bacterium]
MRSVSAIVCVLFVVVLLSGCGREGESCAVSSKASRPVVFTTFYPTAYFAERIGGEHIKVVCPVPEAADAIFWMPDDAVIQDYQKADLIVLNGAGFSKWVGKVSLPESRIVDTALPFCDSFIRFEDAVVHSHGPGGAHAHEGIDGHTWMDPVNAKVQAGEILNALVERWPEWEPRFAVGYASLAKDLDGLAARLAAFRDMPGSPPAMFASHPAYNYVVRRYQWNVANLDLDPEVMPTPAELAQIRERFRGFMAGTLMWESEPLPEVAELMKSELGLESIVFSPCELLTAAQRARGDDYISIMHGNLDRLQVVYGDAE